MAYLIINVHDDKGSRGSSIDDVGVLVSTDLNQVAESHPALCVCVCGEGQGLGLGVCVCEHIRGSPG